MQPDASTAPCGGVRNFLLDGKNGFSGTGIPMSQFAKALSNVLRVWVDDKTGLEGSFDARIIWTPDQVVRPIGGNSTDITPDNFSTSFFTALQEQLGLKLQSVRGPVEVLVIDHAEKPSPN